MAAASPLDLHSGGVRDSAAANNYWADRFGSGFFASLAALQQGGVSSAPVVSAPPAPVVAEPIITLRESRQRKHKQNKQQKRRKIAKYELTVSNYVILSKVQ